MAETNLTLTAEETEFLTNLLGTVLKDAKVEEHRTRTLSYRESIVHKEEVIASVLKKLAPGQH